ncbi:hypothetical protein C8F04DRAFT_1030405 [Mycena alexandri]|uniref:BTB domain-containing protein n=1 Tax=Mycena alexandri TaxID=1745969 RepID=A0AAD6XBS9_9AGAR|nr:hypothetical protein C8F04DRAFT_1030405 [Mycena alexandri]
MPAELTVVPNRSLEFWFPDGDVILSCPQPDGRPFVYRVHRFILSQHSMPFAEMFKTESLAPRQTLEGLPVLPLPEPATEIYKLLCCLYNALNRAAFHDLERPITRYDWLLRISIQYKIGPLRESIISQLKTEWPIALAGWDAREAHIGVLRRQHAAAGGRVHNMWLDDRLSEPVLTIHTARSIGLLQLLPAAFYDLTRRDPRADWNALHTVATRLLPENERLLAQGVRSARWSALSAQDLLVLAGLKETLSMLVRDMWDCKRMAQMAHPACELRRNEILDRAKEMAIVTRDPLHAAQVARQYTTNAGMCKPCEAEVVKCFLTFRVCCWQTLVKKFLKQGCIN